MLIHWWETGRVRHDPESVKAEKMVYVKDQDILVHVARGRERPRRR
jgi:hypothetical protein